VNALSSRPDGAPGAAGAFELYIFDFDGTLANSEPWFREVWGGIAEKFGLPRLSNAQLDELRGLSSRQILKALKVRMWRLPQIARHFHALSELAPPHPLYPGIAELLRTLRARGARIAIVSSNTETVVRKALGRELSALVCHWGCKASLFGKAPKFRKAIRTLAVPKSAVVAIGDETRDIDAARAVGVACAAVRWGLATEAAIARMAPDFCLSSPQEVLALAPGLVQGARAAAGGANPLPSDHDPDGTS
jgi:phosphoglycolate phosphatase